MKKFTKVMLVLTAVVAIAGVGLCGAGVAMGATTESVAVVRKVKNMVKDGHWMALADWDDYWDDDWDDDWDERHTYSDSTVTGNTEGDCRVYTFSDGELGRAEEMEFDLRYDELIFEPYDGAELRIEIYNDDAENIRVRAGDDGFEIKSTARTDDDRTVMVYYPEGEALPFLKLDISVDAGVVTMGDLEVDELDVSVGAGVFEGNGEITAREASFEVGAGSIRVDGLTANEIDGECGMGEMILTVNGSEEEWNYQVEVGAGQVTIGNESYSVLAGEKNLTNPGAMKKMDLECGMGSIEVDFI